jgi:hypothetical protein
LVRKRTGEGKRKMKSKKEEERREQKSKGRRERWSVTTDSNCKHTWCIDVLPLG